MSNSFKELGRPLLEKILHLKKTSEEKVMARCADIPEEHFQFVLFRSLSIQTYAVYYIINSEYYMVVSEDNYIILPSKTFSPTEENDQFKLHVKLSRFRIPIEEVLSLIPKPAGRYLCFHLDILDQNP